MTYQEFRNKWLGRRIDYDLFGWVNSSVFRPSEHYKILNSVVSFVVIYMMNNLVRIKDSTKTFFYNQSVFSNLIVVCARMFGIVNVDITRITNSTTVPSRMVSRVFSYVLLVTFITTKYFITFFSTLILPKFLQAIVTPKQALSRLVVAGSRASSLFSTSSSILARWSLIFSKTNIANIYHINNYTGNTVWSQ